MTAPAADPRARLASWWHARQAGSTPQRWTGLDLGGSSIKLVEVERTPEGWRLVHYLVQELPHAPEGSVDRAGWLHSALKEFGARDVHVSLNGPEVVVRRLHMPIMPSREVPEAVKWQVKDQLPFAVSDAVLAFRLIGEVWERDIKKQDVLVAAAPAAFVNEQLAMVQASGVRVASLTPSPLAIWTCVEALIPDARQGSVAIIELGARTTHVTIVKDGQVRAVRDLAIGSANVTEALMGVVAAERGEVTIDLGMAEAMKRRYGVVTPETEGATEDGVPLFHLASLMRPVMESLLTELSRFFDFYKVQVDDAGVARLLVCGGGSNLKQLQAFLAEGLGRTVEMFNPLVRLPQRDVTLSAEQVAESGPRLGVAIGLAINHGEVLNLLPQELQRRRRAVVLRRQWRAIALAGGTLLLAAACTLLGHLGWLSWRVSVKQAAWGRLEPGYAGYQDLAATERRASAAAARLQALIDRQPVWDGVLKELGELLPSSLQLERIDLSAAPTREGGANASDAPLRVTLAGRAIADSATAQVTIAQFIELLERSIFFRDARLVNTHVDASTTGITMFEVEGWLRE